MIRFAQVRFTRHRSVRFRFTQQRFAQVRFTRHRSVRFQLAQVLALVLACSPAFAQDKALVDAQRDHWAYDAMQSLHARGILVGYPDGYFRGRRTLTRFEFAAALDRALRNLGERAGRDGIAGPRGPEGPRGPMGEMGLQGPLPDLTLDLREIESLRRLVGEFRVELGRLGASMPAINKRVDDLQRALIEIRAGLNRQPRISGGAWIGVRSDIADGGYVDRDGRVMGIPGTPNLSAQQAVVHNIHLNVESPLPGRAAITAAIAAGNYKNYLGGSFARDLPLLPQPPADVYLQRLAFTAPLGSSRLTMGRFGQKATRFTLWRPNVDSYFKDPFVPEGEVTLDGFRIDSRFGSVNLQAFAGQTSSVQGTFKPPIVFLPTGGGVGGAAGGPLGGSWSAPIAGISSGPLGLQLFSGSNKPIGQPNQGQMLVNQIAGIQATVGQEGGRRLSLVVLDMGGAGGAGFNNVLVLGAQGDLPLFGRYRINAGWAKTLTGTGRTTSVNAHRNNAFRIGADWSSGPWSVGAAYQYVDERFYSPAYWARFGNWINPVNYRGAEVRLGWRMSRALHVALGLDYMNPIRERAAMGGFSTNDDINRVMVGLHWKGSDAFGLNVDWEGVRTHLRGPHSGIPLLGAGDVHVAENYIDFSTAYRLTRTTNLKLLYQISSFFGHGSVLNGAGTRSNFNSLVAQMAASF